MSNPDKCKQMAIEVTKQLAEESKRDAKGVSWDVYQNECDRNDGLEYEIEELKKLAYLVDQRNEQGEGNVISYKDAFESASPTLTQIRSIGANAIREAAKSLCWYRGLPNTVDASELNDYADKLEAGTL
jgi:hypothetical protein